MVLLDAVLVLAIVALAAYVLLPAPLGTLSSGAIRAEAVQVSARFREARTWAIAGHAPVDIVVDTATGEITGPGQPLNIRRDVLLHWVSSDQCPLDRGRRALRFLPDGRSCGGVLTMSGGGHVAELRVDWLTGRVEMALP